MASSIDNLFETDNIWVTRIYRRSELQDGGFSEESQQKTTFINFQKHIYSEYSESIKRN